MCLERSQGESPYILRPSLTDGSREFPRLSPSSAVRIPPLRDMIAVTWLFRLSLHLSWPFTITRGCSARRSVTKRHIFYTPFFLQSVILGDSCPGLSMWVCENGVHGMGLDQVSGKKAFRKHHWNIHCLSAFKLRVGWNSLPMNVQGRSLPRRQIQSMCKHGQKDDFCGCFFCFVFTLQSRADYILLNKLFFSRHWASFILEEREKRGN